jgi:molecular chaperone GrpE
LGNRLGEFVEWQVRSNFLERREVKLIEFQGDKPDFDFCEIRDDLEEKTITQIVRKGFRFGESTLRPIEVITSKKPGDAIE